MMKHAITQAIVSCLSTRRPTAPHKPRFTAPRGLALVGLLTTAMAAPSRAAELPSVRFGAQTALTTPSAANSYFSSAPAPASTICGAGLPAAACTAAIEATARGLGAGRPGAPITPRTYMRNAFEYVHNFIGITPTFGLTKGAQGALLDRYGTAFDQADLLAKLLRAQGDITASFKYGKITLTGAQIRTWLGTRSPQATCYLMANGGIPGSVSCETNCASLSAAATDSYSAEIAHVWVEAVVPTVGAETGGTFLLDPSFKEHTYFAGVSDLGATIFGSTGLTVSGIRSTALTGSDGTALGTSPSVPARKGIDRTNLAGAYNRLAASLTSHVQGLDNPRIEQVIGGRELKAYTIPAVTPAAIMPYGTGNASVSATWTDIPNAYRTAISLAYDNLDLTFYADEIYTYGVSIAKADETAAGFVYFSDPKVLVGDTVVATAGDAADTFSIGINHPYAANSGAYMDRTGSNIIEKNLAYTNSRSMGTDDPNINIVLGLGAADKARPDWERSTLTTAAYFVDKFHRLEHRLMRKVVIAEWLGLTTQLDRMTSQVTNSTIQHHHSLGYVNSNVAHHHFDADSGLSISVPDNDVDAKRGVKIGLSASRAVLEGYTIRGAVSSGSPNTAPEVFTSLMIPGNSFLANRNKNSVTDESPRFFDVTGPTAYGVASGAAMDYLSPTQETNAEAYMGQYVDAGYRVIMSEMGAVYGWNDPGADLPPNPYDPHNPFLRRTAFLAISADGNDIAHMVSDDDAGQQFLKGATGPGADEGLPDMELFTPKLRNSTQPAVGAGVNVDPMTGMPTLSHTDMVTGSGSFPYSLPFTRTYSPQDRQEKLSIIPGGWKHNYNKRLNTASDPFAALGYGRNTPAQAAVPAVVSIFMAAKMVEGGDDMESIILGEALASFVSASADRNVMMAETFDGTVRLYKTASAWLPERNQIATLSTKFISGENVLYTRLTTKAGVEYYYKEENDAVPHDNCDLGPTTGGVSPGTKGGLAVVRWPSGVHVEIGLSNNCEAPTGSVRNSFGRGFTFSAGGTGDTIEITEVVGGVDKRQMTMNASDVTLPGGQVIHYEFDGQGRLTHVELPADEGDLPDSFAATFDYDAFHRVESVRDAEDRLTYYGYAGFSQSGRTDIVGGIQEDTAVTPAVLKTALAFATSTSFDIFGGALRSIDGEGNLTLQEYDSLGRLAKRTSPELNYVTYEYDARHNRIEERRTPKPASPEPVLVRTFDFETTCALTTTGFSTATVNACDRPITIEDARTNVTTLTFDQTVRNYSNLDAWSGLSVVSGSATGNGLVESVRRPCPDSGTCGVGDVNAPTTTYAYNAVGQPTSITDPTDIVTAYGYTGGHLTAVEVDDGGLELTTSYTYNDQGDVEHSTDPRGTVIDYEFDANRRLTKIVDPNDSYTLNTYNENGWLTVVRRFNAANDLQQQTETIYRRDGQVWKTRGPECFDAASVFTPLADGCAIAENRYDFAGRLGTTIDPEGRITARDYDRNGKLTVLHSAVDTAMAQATATYTYFPNGSRASAMDANGNVVTYLPDGHDRLKRVDYPTNKVCSAVSPCSPTVPNTPVGTDYETFAYDNNDNMLSKRTRGNAIIARTFDALNREELRTTTNGVLERSITTTYDDADRVLTVADSFTGIEVAYGHDSAGRINGETYDDGTSRAIAYDLDAGGNTTGITWPDSSPLKVGYAYDPLNNVTQICHGATANASCAGMSDYAVYSYDPLYRRDGTTLGNGRTISYAYAKDSMLEHIVQPDLIDTDADNTGDADATWAFEFTKANQMASKEQPQAFIWLPGAGGIGAVNYVATGLNQYNTVKGVTVLYEPAGNMTSDGTWTYTYDGENRMTGACDSIVHTPSPCTGATTVAAYVYDPLDRRVQKTVNGLVTKYLWAGQNIIAEYDGAGTLLRRYVHGPGVDEPVVQVDYSPSPATHYFHQDHLGSVVALTDDTGQLEDTYSYSTHGEVGEEGGAGSIWRYTGRQLDEETGLYYYRARMYSPGLGRFLQVDPAGDVDSLNLYQYALWDPILRIDPFGEETEEITVYGDKNDCSWASSCQSYNAADLLSNPPVMILPLIEAPAAALAVTIQAGVSLVKKAVRSAFGPKKREWNLGDHKSAKKWQNQMAKRGWTKQQIDRAVANGDQFPAQNNVNPGNSATRFVDPETGRSIVIDDVTNEVIHVGGDGFKY